MARNLGCTLIIGGESNDVGTFEDIPAGTYDLVVQDGSECSVTVSIEVDPQSIFFTMPYTEVDASFGETVTLNVETNVPLAMIDTIVWSPAEGLSCGNCLNPSFVAELTTSYEVVITSLGCEYTTTVLVRVDKDFGIYFPNSFIQIQMASMTSLDHLLKKELLRLLITSEYMIDEEA